MGCASSTEISTKASAEKELTYEQQQIKSRLEYRDLNVVEELMKEYPLVLSDDPIHNKDPGGAVDEGLVWENGINRIHSELKDGEWDVNFDEAKNQKLDFKILEERYKTIVHNLKTKAVLFLIHWLPHPGIQNINCRRALLSTALEYYSKEIPNAQELFDKGKIDAENYLADAESRSKVKWEKFRQDYDAHIEKVHKVLAAKIKEMRPKFDAWQNSAMSLVKVKKAVNGKLYKFTSSTTDSIGCSPDYGLTDGSVFCEILEEEGHWAFVVSPEVIQPLTLDCRSSCQSLQSL